MCHGCHKIVFTTGKINYTYVSQSVFFRTKSCGKIILMTSPSQKKLLGGGVLWSNKIGRYSVKNVKYIYFMSNLSEPGMGWCTLKIFLNNVFQI